MPVFTIEYEDPVFSIAFHPEQKEFIVGFGSGRVTAYEYTYDSDPKVKWTTKRHKSSCRGALYSQDGKHVFTAGSDKIIKKASSETGKVVAKTETRGVPSAFVLNSHYIFVGDDDGNLEVLDLDLHQTHQIQEVVPDCVNSIATLDHKNQYNILVTGMSTLVSIDIRKGIKTTSEDQEDELLCSAVPNERQSVFGMSEGFLTFWTNEYLVDQQNRLRLTKEGTVDSIIAGETEESVFAGTSEGVVYEVDTRACKILGTVTHSQPEEGEEVSFLDWDCEYHLVTGSLGRITLWNKGEHDIKPESTPQETSDKTKKRKNKTKNKNKKGQEAKRAKMFTDL